MASGAILKFKDFAATRNLVLRPRRVLQLGRVSGIAKAQQAGRALLARIRVRADNVPCVGIALEALLHIVRRVLSFVACRAGLEPIFTGNLISLPRP